MGHVGVKKGEKGNVQHRCNGVEARISRNNTAYREYYSDDEAISLGTTAEHLARQWVLRKKSSLGQPVNGHGSYRRTPRPDKTSSLPPGVSRYIREDNRSGIVRFILVFSANYQTHCGMNKTKQFRVGQVDRITLDQVEHAKLTAIAFRRAWEKSVSQQERFDRSVFRNWRIEVLYTPKGNVKRLSKIAPAGNRPAP